MKRFHVHVHVDDLAKSIGFYSKLFGTAPAKVREGYANFAIAEPPLKLVLIAGGGAPGTLNHLGVEVETPELVGAAIGRLQAEGLATKVEEQTTCCYAVQDKVWVHGPDAEPWEVYTVLADASAMRLELAVDGGDACCAPSAAEPVDIGCRPVPTAEEVASACCAPAAPKASSGCC